MQRTDQQNKALHLWFRLVAKELKDLHYDFRSVKVELSPTEELVKAAMWKPVQKALYGKKSTTELSRLETAEVYDHLNRMLGDRFGIYVPWPDKKHEDDSETPREAKR